MKVAHKKGKREFTSTEREGRIKKHEYIKQFTHTRILEIKGNIQEYI